MTRRAVPRVTRAPDPASSELAPPESTVAAHAAVRLDPVIHERLRLAIVHVLANRASLTFMELKRLLGMTDGNLSVHSKRLEEVGYIEMRRQVQGRVSRTEYRLTAAGRRALDRYLNDLETLIAAIRR